MWTWEWSRQKAPSAKRCIKTITFCVDPDPSLDRQKAPSAKRCIKTRLAEATRSSAPPSESTERQKVH